MKNTEWIAPALLVVGIFAIWLALSYLPLESFGLSISGDSLWIYMPWLVIFAVGLYTLKIVYRRH